MLSVQPTRSSRFKIGSMQIPRAENSPSLHGVDAAMPRELMSKSSDMRDLNPEHAWLQLAGCV